ncbi:MAG TPA: hypothetical protein VJ867_15195 [Gemmatimonadaceae bacterium]|nr:hypothetical protein [Gemmatimonadaceae bacterium]
MAADTMADKRSDAATGGYNPNTVSATAGIDYGRVAVGGVAAAVVMIVIGVLGNKFVFGQRMQAEMAAAAPTLPRTPSTTAIVAAIATQVIVGLMLVWLYAAMRPRFGAGPGTAAKAAAVVWIFGFLFYQDWLHVGLMTGTTYAIVSVVQAISVLAGALAGARLYGENPRT